MVITDTLEVRVPTLLAADATTLAPAALALNVYLVAAVFTPARGTRFANLTVAVGGGLEAKNPGVGAQIMGFDPAKNVWKVILREPAGGWNYVSTAVTDPVETIHGYVVTNDDDTETYGSDLLAEGPVTINAIGIVVSLPEIVVWVPVGVMTSPVDQDE